MGLVRPPDDYGEWMSGAAAFKRAFLDNLEAAFECYDVRPLRGRLGNLARSSGDQRRLAVEILSVPHLGSRATNTRAELPLARTISTVVSD
jgi:hypothetical protein